MDTLFKPSVTSQFTKPRTLFILIAMTVFIMARCSGSRVQCEKMLEMVNRGHALIHTTQNQYDVATTQQLATELESVATEIETVKVSDGKLQSMQTRFATVYGELSQTLNTISTTLRTAEQAPITLQGRQQLEDATERLLTVGETANQTGKAVDELIDEINLYCPQ
jgi:DNA repair ATPase RecN